MTTSKVQPFYIKNFCYFIINIVQLNQFYKEIELNISSIFGKNLFVDLKSNSALLYNKGHNLLASAFPPKMLN